MTQGFGSAKERKALLDNTFSNLKSKIMRLNETSTHLEKKSQCMMIAPSKAWICLICNADYKDCNAVYNKARKTNCAYKPTPFLCNNASLEWENCVRHGEWFARRYYPSLRSRWTLSRANPLFRR